MSTHPKNNLYWHYCKLYITIYLLLFPSFHHQDVSELPIPLFCLISHGTEPKNLAVMPLLCLGDIEKTSHFYTIILIPFPMNNNTVNYNVQ